MSSQRSAIHTSQAPAAIGTYSQAMQVGNLVFMSGQIPLVPKTMTLVGDDPEAQIRQVFRNLTSVAEAAGGSLAKVVKFNVFLTDLSLFPIVNSVMAELLSEPYPARAAVEVSALPKGAKVEVEAVMAL